jgi:hypothetical protein
MDKEQWKNSILESMNQAQRAEPAADLFDRISAKLDRNQGAKVIPMAYIRLAAACFAGLLVMNIWALSGRTNTAMPNKPSDPGSTAYQLEKVNYKLYDL